MPGVLPNSHAAGVMIHSSLPLRVGLQVYLIPKYDLPKLISYVREYRLSAVFFVPTIWQQIAKSEEIVAADLSSIRFAMSGAAALSPVIQREASTKLAQGVCVIQNWGMTELVCEGVQLNVNEVETTGSVGRLLPNLEAMIIGTDGKPKGPNQEGEIVLRGPNVTKGYYKNEAATQSSIKQGWLHTGDLAKFSTDGKLYIIGRLKVRSPPTMRPHSTNRLRPRFRN